ncbi:Glycosyltransferase involved in cell wall bisynthesis [Tangfeifania diversioriginum]|uniref:Glycosyltransferase involved in cell wall bisynthesis n=1 Tax=Tangfeifania diversioriginum TaxID=1168035 RepID=A0A1M6AL21_9BACT|nr:glycosyltransferase family 4 protein [Tangfeifania diversioriginum]SHI37162.1 Glycosyltransferase involved in cell wall bisynthesis [Tangfeifania diversioriginum]
MKKVLIITYYWPPSGGGGVMRWLKMSKYLPGLGWKPVIFTPENPDASVVDESLTAEIHPETEILKTPIWEPYEVFRKLTGKKKGEKFKAGYISEASSGNWKSKLSVFIRGNFLIPDPRKFWIKPSVKFLTNYLKENPVDLIISTGPPHSMHLIALGLKEKFAIPWIADFRDPWTDIDFYNKLRLTKWGDKKHRKLELKVLQKADHVVTVSPNCAKDLSKIHGKKVEIIHNGFDPEDFEGISFSPDNSFSISHFGAFNRDRNPKVLWKVLGKLAEENRTFKEKLRIRLIGQTDDSVIQEIENNGLKENLVQTEHLPHKKGLEELAKSQVLLLPINDAPNARGILPGKMYEYMAMKRPILAIGPTDADFVNILNETKTGIAFDFNDAVGIRKTLENYFNLFIEGELQVESSAFEKFSRKNLAQKFIDLSGK